MNIVVLIVLLVFSLAAILRFILLKFLSLLYQLNVGRICLWLTFWRSNIFSLLFVLLPLTCSLLPISWGRWRTSGCIPTIIARRLAFCDQNQQGYHNQQGQIVFCLYHANNKYILRQGSAKSKSDLPHDKSNSYAANTSNSFFLNNRQKI